MPKISTTAEIDYRPTTGKRASYVEQLVNSSLSRSLKAQEAAHVAGECRVRVIEQTTSKNSPVELAIFYVNGLVSTATLYLIPAYLRTTYTVKVTIEDSEGTSLRARSFTESKHMFVHFAAGFIGPENRLFESNAEEEIAQRLASHSVAEIQRALVILPCASNHSLKADGADAPRL